MENCSGREKHVLQHSVIKKKKKRLAIELRFQCTIRMHFEKVNRESEQLMTSATSWR